MGDALSTAFANVTKESLGPTIQKVKGDEDSFFNEIFEDRSARMVDPSIGRGWAVSKIVQVGGAGAIEYDSLDGNSYASEISPSAGIGDNFNLYGENSIRTWPGANESPNPGFLRYGFSLVQARGNMFTNADVIRRASLGLSIGDEMQASIESFARRIARFLSANWWKEGSSTSGLNNTVVTFATPSSGTLAITANGFNDATNYQNLVVATGQIMRLSDSDRYDIRNGSGVRQNAADQPVFVDNVDPWSKSFNLKIKNGSNISLSTSTTYHLVPRKATPASGVTADTAAYGLTDFIKSSGTIGETIGGNTPISLARYPALRSFVKDMGGATLSEFEFLKLLTLAATVLGSNFKVDTFVGEPALFTALIEEQMLGGSILSLTVNRGANDVQTFKGGFDTGDMGFRYGDRTYRYKMSPYAHQGTLWGLKTRDRNFKMILPPRVPGTTGGPVNDYAVEFAAPFIYGGKSIWAPYHSPISPVGALTETLQAPIWMPHQFWPDWIPGMKLTNLATASEDALSVQTTAV